MQAKPGASWMNWMKVFYQNSNTYKKNVWTLIAIRAAYTGNSTNPEGVVHMDSGVNGAPWSCAGVLVETQSRNMNSSWGSTGRPLRGKGGSAESGKLSRNFVRLMKQAGVFRERKTTWKNVVCVHLEKSKQSVGAQSVKGWAIGNEDKKGA